ncbi:hypothetical protein NEF87_004691 [Candidatus Lokiarchaeum ossiferum]|uniref:YdbS-like PH domain-containing protein n=1 Tax=Candidatus Lokiarchaeum ossiferum TaxID=2951803 RepID=A0ABY6I0R0_9ARCH|nr:hypothetical protein NEF87_004691 [Candidatus Lokiarchaeum sp. B-35]
MTEEADPILTEINHIVDLEEDEQVFKTIQRTNHSYFIPKIAHNSILWIIILVIQIVLGLTFPTIKSVMGTIVLIFFYVWLGIFLISMLVGKWFVQGHMYVITNKRIIMQRKFLGILFREIEYKRITDLVLRQSLWGRIFNFGVLLPVTAGVEMGATKFGMFSIEGIMDVFKVRNIVLDQIRINQDQMRQKYYDRRAKNTVENLKDPDHQENIKE